MCNSMSLWSHPPPPPPPHQFLLRWKMSIVGCFSDVLLHQWSVCACMHACVHILSHYNMCESELQWYLWTINSYLWTLYACLGLRHNTLEEAKFVSDNLCTVKRKFGCASCLTAVIGKLSIWHKCNGFIYVCYKERVCKLRTFEYS